MPASRLFALTPGEPAGIGPDLCLLLAREAQHIVAINDYALRQYQARTHAQFYRINVPIGEVFFRAPERSPETMIAKAWSPR